MASVGQKELLFYIGGTGTFSLSRGQKEEGATQTSGGTESGRVSSKGGALERE